MNFLFREQGFIFIHLPKNGGSTIRRMFENKSTAKAQGIVPNNWGQRPVLAIVRDPIDRFLSGVNMFKFGTPDAGGYYASARWPELTTEKALTILLDKRIGYDRTTRNLPSNLKHHLWPQTEPFNSLESATHIIRFEDFENGLADFLGEIGLQKKVPHVRTTSDNPKRILRQELSASEIASLEKFYAKDFAELGYPTFSSQLVDARTYLAQDKLRSSWRVYFENIIFDDQTIEEVLPNTQVDLTVFSQEPVPGSKKGTWTKRKKKLLEHFKNLEPEFAGSMRLSHLLACVIVSLRRKPNNKHARILFYRIIGEKNREITKDLNLRWLVSVCDTIVDTSENPADRSIALLGSLVAGICKLSDTEHKQFCPFASNQSKVRFSGGGALYDGTIQYWTEGGDLIKNLLRRTDSILASDSVASSFVAEILLRLQEHDSIIKRMQDLHGKDPLPVANYRERMRLAKLMLRSNRRPSSAVLWRFARYFGGGN